MSPLLQKLLVAFGRRGVVVPIDETLGELYRQLGAYHDQYPNVFNNAVEVLLAEVEGGGLDVGDVARRLGRLLHMLDRLHRQEDLEAWVSEPITIVG